MENKIIVGIDVAKKFSYYSIITPNGKQYGKPFKAHNTLEGLEKVSKKAERSRERAQCPMCVGHGINWTLLEHTFPLLSQF
ncbi:hypothetical protein SAMN02745135_01749 [Caloranaerobacter azorensis DSM 13643]|uniref:Transposase n=1 Tax=Caloranaerobacter azorensis DSM 13643 TaxID=1121264 RepID=A0A1M5V525_9FIRM|nr:hypothetical protein [Caloranaerobacter azorensis]SHH70342.1 hypothetical protein SAMN02745135_01749 [Caloranaerobacter azorensis DSM 13643]